MPVVNLGKTMDPEQKRICDEFNKNKTLSEFSRLCDMNPKYSNRQKCRICGNDIFYNNVLFAGAYQEYPEIKQGTSFLTVKKICGNTYQLSVCEHCMEECVDGYKDVKNRSRVFNMPNRFTQFAFNIPDSVINEKKTELCVRSEESYIKKFGEDEGKKRWDAYVEKQKYTKSFEYWSKKNNASIEDYEQYNKSRACTLNNMISRHGEEEGRKRWEEYVKKQRYTTSKDYFIKEYGKEDGEKKYKSFIEARDKQGPYSNISQEFFKELSSIKQFSNHRILYATNGKEEQILTGSGRLYYLDYYDYDLKICIEFNGNKFHPKPGEYKKDDIFINPFGEENIVGVLWEKEELRKEDLLNEFGIRTIIVWEDEYKKNKKKCICETVDKILEICKNNII